MKMINTAWKPSKYGVFSGPYFPVFGLNTEIYPNDQQCMKIVQIWRFFWFVLPCIRIEYGDLLKWSTLREKCPNTEFFLVRIFLYLNWIRRFTQISVFRQFSCSAKSGWEFLLKMTLLILLNLSMKKEWYVYLKTKWFYRKVTRYIL